MSNKARGVVVVTLVLIVGGFLLSRFVPNGGTQLGHKVPRLERATESVPHSTQTHSPPSSIETSAFIQKSSPSPQLFEAPSVPPSQPVARAPADTTPSAPKASSRFWLRGVVVTPEQQPVESFEVAVFSQYGPTIPPEDTQAFHSVLGEFELEWTKAGPVDVVVKARGFMEGVLPQVTLANQQENAQRHEVILIPASGIEGIVVNEAGQPVAGAMVELGRYVYSVNVSAPESPLNPEARQAIDTYIKQSNPNPWQETDADGRFALTDLPYGSYPLHVSHADYFPTTEQVSLRPGDSRQGLRLVLSKRGGALVVHVQNVQGLPLPQQAVGIEGSGQQIQGQTDARGLFRADNLSPGTYRVMLQLPDASTAQAAAIRWTEVNIAAGTESTATLVLESGVTVTGEVVQGGQPLIGAHVIVTQVSRGEGQEVAKTEPSTYASSGTQTDEHGRFELTDLPGGTYQLTLMHGEDSAQLSFALSPSDQQRFFRIQLGSAQLSGLVKDGISGKPIEGATIRPFLTQPLEDQEETDDVFHASIEHEVITDAAGRYQLSQLTFGRYVLEAQAFSYGKVRQSVELTGGIVSQDITLMPAGQLIVIVTDAQRIPLPGVAVSVTSQRDPENGVLATTDLQGIVQLADLAPGPYEVIVSSASEVSSQNRTVVTITSEAVERLATTLSK